MPAPDRSSFYGPDALPAAQPTALKHQRHGTEENERKTTKADMPQ